MQEIDNKGPSEKLKRARERNWKIFQAKGNIALWQNFCAEYDIPFDAEKVEADVIAAIRIKYDHDKYR